MKRILFIGCLLPLAMSCSVKETDVFDGLVGEMFYSIIEQPCDTNTKVNVNNDLRVLWDEGDHISIFNKKDANDEYRFTGKTGDDGGSFELVKDFSEEGVPIDKVYAVYPYSRTTSIDTKGVLTVEFPSEQHYREDSFGPGANLMASVSKDKDNSLQFKNVGGYLRIRLYGDGVSVSSITLKGNNGEKLAGKTSVMTPLDGTPTAVMAEDATDEITLICDTPVALGATAEKSNGFWFVVPPVMFSKGFTVSVTQVTGKVFEKTTSKSISIERNKLSRMSPIKVENTIQPNNIIYYTTTDENIIQPYSSNWGANIVSNEYIDGRGVLTFDGDVTSSGQWGNRASLLSVELPESVTSIEPCAFFFNNSFYSVNIPKTVTDIGYCAFLNCSSLVSIDIPDSVTIIGAAAFCGCTSLSSIDIPDSVTSIEGEAFFNCRALTSIVIPGSVTSLHGNVFRGCSGLSSIVVDSKNQNYDSRNNCNAIIETSTNTLIVGCKNTTIQDFIISIGEYAFGGCTDRTSIVIPDSVTSIGDGAFDNCVNLTSITIPEPLIESGLGKGILASCPNLVSINGKRELVVAGVLIAFASAGLDSYTIPEGITSIGESAFRGCSLVSITIPEYVTSIESHAFSSCSNLHSAIIEGRVIGEEAFASCINLVSVTIGKSVTVIGMSAFMACMSLDSIVIPDSVTSVESHAFSNCRGLTSATIGDSVISIGEQSFLGCENLTSVTIGNSVTSIGATAFCGCVLLPSIVIPDSVTSIGRYAFDACFSLKSVTIGESMNNIGQNAFDRCSELSSLTVVAKTPPALYSSLPSNCIIYVPSRYVDTYKIAEGWSEYADRIQPIDEQIDNPVAGTSWTWTEYPITWTFTFTEDEVIFYYFNQEGSTDQYKAKYTYTADTVSFTMNGWSGIVWNYTGTISDDKMYLVDSGIEGIDIVLTKNAS